MAEKVVQSKVFANQKKDRAKCVIRILNSESDKKLIVAGPGTGKTFLFKRLADHVDGDVLAITFINNLAKDLDRELAGSAECRTFHSLCKNFLHHSKLTGITSKFSYFPKLSQIVISDSEILNGTDENYDEAFQKLIDDDGRIDFYLKRGNYYNSVSHNDVVYRSIDIMQRHPKKAPAYDLILVDEYQDFNRLEVELIDILARKNPVVIVGDDDQALYILKFAKPDFLRAKYKDAKYTKFQLPYCSRCTKPVVDATNQIIKSANRFGYLKSRIDKPFECYLPGKAKESTKYPKISLVECSVHMSSAPYMAKYISTEMRKIINEGYRPNHDDSTYDFLIVGRGDLLKGVYDYLSRDYTGIEFKKREENIVTYYDCYAELLINPESNIGWRGIIELEAKRTTENLVKKTAKSKKQFIEIIPCKIAQYHRHILRLLNRIKSAQELSVTEEKQLEDLFKDAYNSIVAALFLQEGTSKNASEEDDDYRAIVTTFMGSKGLSANYVFLIGLNDGILPKTPSKPTDNEICQFIVGLTRTRKKCHLIYANLLRGIYHKPSKFLGWCNNNLLDVIKVDKNYF